MAERTRVFIASTAQAPLLRALASSARCLLRPCLGGNSRPPFAFRPMRSNHGRLLLLMASLLATGSQWDLIQVLAWGRMFWENAARLPLGEALERTFSPTDLCPICEAVRDGKQENSGCGRVVASGIFSK